MSDEPRDDEEGTSSADDVPAHPEEQEEKGIGLTEEFARLEQEIQREVRGEGEEPGSEEPQGADEPEQHPDPEPDAGDADQPAAEVDDVESSEWVAPVPAPGDTEAWSADEAAAAGDAEDTPPEPDAADAGEHQIPADASAAAPGEPADPADETEQPVDPGNPDVPEEAEEPDEATALEHTVVRQGPPPVPVGAYYEENEEDPEVKTPGLWWRFLTASVVIVVTVATATAVSLLVLFTNVAADLNPLPGLGDKLKEVPPGDPQTILLLGSDKRTNIAGDPGRSDTTMLLRVDPDKGVLSMLSLPRDLKVDIAGPNYGVDKLNAAYADGGVKKTVDTVHQLTGLDINHVVNVDFEGFAKAVDAIGCVYVDVDRHYFNDNSNPFEESYAAINVNAGYQRLCGQNALDYVRYRHTDTDIVRAARQQDFLRNARAQVPVKEVLPIVGGDTGGDLIDIFTNYTSSDIDSAAQIIGILQSFINVRDVPINQVKFEGTLGPSYVESTPEQMSKMIDEFLNGKDSPGPTDDTKPKEKKSGGGKKDKQKGGNPTDGANVVSTADLVDPETGVNKFEAFGRTSARRLDFPVYIPTEVVPGSQYSADSRQYDIKDEDDKKQPAYKMVIELPTDSGPFYYGVQGTTWSDPPILEHPSETVTEDGRDYDIYYDGDRIRMVAWHDDQDNSYWVSNTLVQTLDNADMIAIAESMEEVKK